MRVRPTSVGSAGSPTEMGVAASHGVAAARRVEDGVTQRGDRIKKAPALLASLSHGDRTEAEALSREERRPDT
jgi:hypothetical protein